MKYSVLHVLYNGMLECDYANLVAMPVLGNSRQKERLSKWSPSPVTMFLIEHPDGLVLFDTGCHPKAMEERWDEENRLRTPYTFEKENLLVNHLEALGYKPEDVDYVVLSHLHEDHAGGLELFPHAQIFVNDTELAQTLKLYALNGPMGGYIRKDIEAWLKLPLKWNTIPDDEKTYELLDGITILNFGPGHTFGMMGLQVETKNHGTFILASDAVNTKVNYGPPIQYPGLAYDTIGYAKTIRRIQLLEKKTHAQVLFGHDQQQVESLQPYPRARFD